MATEREKFALRLNEALDDAGFPKIGQGRQSALSRLVGVAPQQAGKWLKGEAFPKTSLLVKLAQQLQVRSNWLLSGAGDKPVPRGEEADAAGARLEADGGGEEAGFALGERMLTKEAFDLALAWMRLEAAQREAMRRVILELARER